jgi:malonyl-CoA decarboxylase
MLEHLIARLNWKADPSPLRLSQSLGIMVNYVYEEPKIDQNISNFAKTRQIIVGKQISELLSK